MNKKNKKIYILLAVAILISAIALIKFTKDSNIEQYAQIKGEKFQIEIAQTPQELARGLGYRDSLCERCAMLFSFKEVDYHSFWMKGMRFPLDIIWLEKNKVVHIEKNIKADSQEIYKPPVKSDSVLEINGGISDRMGLKIGDKVEF